MGGWGGGGPSKLSGAEVEAMTQCIGSLMTQAWAGGQTDIFSVEKLLWGPPSGTSLLPTSCRGSLGTKPWGVGFCVCVCAPLPSSLSSNVHPHNLGTQLLTCNTSGLPEDRR